MAGIKIPLDANTNAYVQKMKAAKKHATNLAKEHKKGGKELEKQGKTVGKNNDGLSNMLTKTGLITAAVGGVAAAWKMVAKERAAAAAKIDTELDSSKRLAQVATSAQDKSRLDEEARLFSATSGISLGRAKDVRFSLRSAGDDESLRLFREASKIEENIEGLITGTHTVKGAFGGTSESNLNQLIEASKRSKFSISELAGGAAQGGRSVATTGTSGAEFLALLGSEFGTKSAEVTSTGLKGFASALGNESNKTLQGLRSESGSLIETTKNIRQFMKDKNISIKDLGKVIKSEEGRQGFLTVSNAIDSGTIGADIEAIENSEGALGRTVGNLSRGDRAAIRRREAQATFDITGIPEGIEALDIQSQSLIENASTRNSNFINRGATFLQGVGREFFGVDSGQTSEQQNDIVGSLMLRVSSTLQEMSDFDKNRPNLGVKNP